MRTPHNPLFAKTYDPNNECWAVLAALYEEQLHSTSQNESEKEEQNNG